MTYEVAGAWGEDEERVYRGLRGFLGERPRHADCEDQEELDAVQRIVANMETELTETMDELEALRGEKVFDPDEYVQEFTYAGTRMKVVNRSSRLIVDMVDEDCLGEPNGVTMRDMRRCHSALLRAEYDMNVSGPYRKAVSAVMRRAPSPAFGDSMKSHLANTFQEAGYTHAYLYGDAEERIDDALELARTPLKERPTEADGYTVRMGGAKMKDGRIDV